MITTHNKGLSDMQALTFYILALVTGVQHCKQSSGDRLGVQLQTASLILVPDLFHSPNHQARPDALTCYSGVAGKQHVAASTSHAEKPCGMFPSSSCYRCQSPAAASSPSTLLHSGQMCTAGTLPTFDHS
jgi:hypothetical protein